MKIPKIKNNGSEVVKKKRERDKPLPALSSVIPYVSYALSVFEVCRVLRVTHSQVILLFVLCNARDRGYTMSFICNVVYGDKSKVKFVSIGSRIRVLRERGYVVMIDNRYMVSRLFWDRLASVISDV